MRDQVLAYILTNALIGYPAMGAFVALTKESTMSVNTRPAHTDALVISCNRCVATINVGGAISIPQARTLAARAGWDTITVGRAVKDLCPNCQKG